MRALNHYIPKRLLPLILPIIHRCAAAVVCLFALSLHAADRTFTLGGTNAVLQDASSEVDVYYSAMRFNRAQNAWNVDVTLSNKSALVLHGPVLLLVDSYGGGTTGPRQPDGWDDSVPALGWYDFSGALTFSVFSPGDRSSARTLTLGYTNGTPRMTARAFVQSKTSIGGLALSRSLNEVGQPLGGVTVVEAGPAGLKTNLTDATYGVVTLGQGAGLHSWLFSTPGYLPAWRNWTLGADSVALVPTPRLVQRSTNGVALTPLDGGQITNASGSLQIAFPPAAFAQTVTAWLTPLTAQTLPALLPQGWSPLQAFALDLGSEPGLAGTVLMQLWGPVAAGESAAWVRWNPGNLQWEVLALLTGDGSGSLTAPVAASGSYALVVADSGALAPPAAQVGQGLPASSTPVPSFTAVTASGKVEPMSSPASRTPELVTAQAQVTITNAGGSLPSGLLLRCNVSEDYRLRDGTHLALPFYEHFIVGYHRPGANPPAALQAAFPMRPVMLLGADELDQATVQVDVLAPAAFSGRVVDENGGQISVGSTTLRVGVGDLGGRQAVQLQEVAVTNFSGFATNGLTLVQAFDLSVSGVVSGRHLTLQLTGLPTNALFVLAKLVSQSGLYGLQPTERLATGTNGVLSSLEPASGERLPGVTGTGRYLLVQVTALQGLISGIARNAQGQPSAGLPVRLSGQPWLTFSAAGGLFQLVAPVGTVTVATTDLASGNTGQTDVIITDPAAVVTATLGVSAAGPRVAAVTPADGTTAVSRVTSVIVQFTKAINPGSLGTNGIQLLDTNSQPVTATLTLNLKNTVATLLPTSQLAASMRYSIVLLTNITDPGGLPLEGPSTFPFTTESDQLNRNPNAQLISYEPTNGNSVVVGTPGLADPNSPVIIVNETSGRTATVPSNPDGSFTNVIQAEVDDMLSATLVNQNGTRNTALLSKQIFRDGSVGLFDGGGTVDARTPDGTLRLAVEPGAIVGKCKFKLETLTVAQVQDLSSNTPPDNNAALIGGFKVAMDGQRLKVGAHVSFPINEASLGLASGDSASNHVFAMCEPVTADGVQVYRVLDSMSFEDGKVVSHSPPFDGLADIPGGGLVAALVMFPFNMAQKMAVVGSVVAATDSLYDDVRLKGAAFFTTNAGVRALPNAWVSAYPQSGVFETHKGLTPGVFVALANSAGFFSYLLPFNPFTGSGYLLAAQSPLFPNQMATRAVYAAPGAPAASTDLIFRMPDTGTGRVDNEPPMITANPPGSVMPINQTNSLEFLIRDNLTAPRFDRIDLVPAKSFSLLQTNQPVIPLDPAKVTLWQSSFPATLGPTSISAPVDFLVKEPAIVTVNVRAADADLNFADTEFTFYFGAAPAATPGAIVSADPNDTTPPQVARTVPPANALLELDAPIVVGFSKAVDPSITNGLGVALSGPVPSVPVRIELSEDQQVAFIYPVGLSPGTNYILTINGSVKDLNGNSLDQDPSTSTLEPFKLPFKTAPAPVRTLPSLGRPSGTLVFQSRSFTLDAAAPSVGPAIVVHQLGDPITVLTNIALPSLPRAMTIIPQYRFVRNYVSPVESKPILVVVGGTVGAGGDGQWIRLYDISRTNWVDRLGSAFLTTDQNSAVSNVKYSSPNLFVHIVGPGGSYLQAINLQALIIGCNLPYLTDANLNPSDPNKWPTNALPYQMISGVDTNGDGDYVEAGETLPIPQKYALFGLDHIIQAAMNRDFTDFDVQAGGAFIATTMMSYSTNAPRFQYMVDSGMLVGIGDDANGAYEFTNVRPFRVALDLGFPLPNSMGGKQINAALVSAGPWLYLFDLSVPQLPKLVNMLKVADDPGLISAITRSGADEYSIGAANGLYVLQRSMMGLDVGITAIHPAVRQQYAFSTSGRALGVSSGYYTATGASGAQAMTRPPQFSILRAISLAPTNILSIIAAGPEKVNDFLVQLTAASFVLPAQAPSTQTPSASDFSPGNPLVHYYASVEASGENGPEIRLALESLDKNGQPLRPKTPLFPPVLLTSFTNPVETLYQQPAVDALVARRLSTNIADRAYNFYVTDPFVLLRSPLNSDDTNQLAQIRGRQALWSGNFVRVSMDHQQNAGFRLIDFKSGVQGRFFQAGLSRTFGSFPGDLTDNPNPSLRVAPRQAGVNLQSGEFRHSSVDILVPGRHQDLSLARSYSSRSPLSGVFGPGWDFNWNTRILEVPSGMTRTLTLTQSGQPGKDRVMSANDVMVMDSQGAIRLFTHIPADSAHTNQSAPYASDPAVAAFGWKDRIAQYYESPKGEFSVLFKFTDGSYVVLAPNGSRTYFLPDGRLHKVVGIFEASQLVCQYRSDGRLDRVLGDRDNELRFGYYVDSLYSNRRPADKDLTQPTDQDRVSRVQLYNLSGFQGEVGYTYDTNGFLVSVTDLKNQPTTYRYDSQPPCQLTFIGASGGSASMNQTISYTNGMVTKVSRDGVDINFAGAVQTAADRFSGGSNQVTVAQGTGAPVPFDVDELGRPTAFAGLEVKADEHGMLTNVSETEIRATVFYDRANTVYRFRGNLIGTARKGSSSHGTTNIYDGSAWNRLSLSTSTEGTTNSYAYVERSGRVGQVSEASGPISRTTYLNDYGQVTRLELAEGSHTLVTTYSFTNGLPVGEICGDGADVMPAQTLNPGGRGAVASLGVGNVSLTANYDANGRFAGATPQGSSGLPGLTINYNDHEVESDQVYAGTRGLTNSYTYDPGAHDRIQTLTETESGLPGISAQFAYKPSGQIDSVALAGETNSFAYNGVQMTGYRSPGVKRQVDFAGALATNVTEQGVSARLTYDPDQRLQTITQQGLRTTFDYNQGDQVKSKTLSDTNGAVLAQETYQYDPAGRVQFVIGGQFTREFQYFADGVQRRVLIDGDLRKEIERDTAGRLLTQRYPGLAEYGFSDFDPDTGQPKTETLKLYTTESGGIAFVPFTHQMTYDDRGQLRTYWPGSGTWTYNYDEFGNLTNSVDPDNVSESHDFSPSGVALSIGFSDGTRVAYDYYPNRRQRWIDRLEFVLDSERLVSQVNYPDGGMVQFADRNAFFEPEKVIDGDRVLQQTWSDGRLTSISGLDQHLQSYDALGRLTNTVLNGYSTTLGYDPRGPINLETNYSPSLSTPPRVWSGQFNNFAQLSAETYPSGWQVDWLAHAHGLPKQANNTPLQSIQWLGPGLLQSIQYAGGLRVIRDYDASTRLYQLRYEAASSTATNPVAGFLYNLTPAGRVLSETRSHEGRADGYVRNGNLEGMRIVNFYFSAVNPTNGSGAVSALEGINFDSNGELISPTNRLGTDVRAFLPEVKVSNWRMTNADGYAVTYNVRGSVETVPLYFRLPGATGLTREIAKLTYNDGGLLQKVERGSGADLVTITYTYDGLGRIVERQVSGPAARCRPGLRQFFWRGQDLLEEYEWTGTTFGLTRRYLYVGDELALVQSAANPGGSLTDYVPLLNLSASVCGYARTDGTLVETILYGAYGAPLFQAQSAGPTEISSSTVASTLLFQSAWYDEETGMYHFGRRTLHPFLGRFLQRDPEPFVVSRALFTAFNGDPAGMVDPSGSVPDFVKNHVPGLNTLLTLKKNYLGLEKPLNEFAAALNATRMDSNRKVTDLGVKGLGLAAAGLKLTESFGCAELTDYSKKVATFNTHLNTALGILNNVADMRRDRMVLTAIKAHALFPAGQDSRLRWLSAGGAAADFKTFVNSDLLQNAAVQKSRSFQAGSPDAQEFLHDFQKKYSIQREAKLLAIGQGVNKLASAYFGWAFKGKGKNADVERSKLLLGASGDLLNLAEQFNKVRKDKDLATMTFFSGEMGAIQSAKAIYGQAAILGATFDVSMSLTEKTIVLCSDPLVSKAYADDVKKFEDNGGFTSVFGGLLNTVGLERAGYRVQQFAEKRLVADAVQKYLGKYMVEGRDPRADYYSQGLRAPP